MFIKWQLNAALVCVAFLSACAQAPHRPLVAERATIKSTDVVAMVRQPDLYAQIVVSNVAAATGGGLLFALIDAGVNASRASDAEESVRPLRDVLVDFDFDETLRGDLEQELSEVDWLGVRGVTVTKEVTDANADKILRESTAGGVLYVNADYNLSADFSTLYVKSAVTFIPRSDEFRGAATRAGVAAPRKTGIQTKRDYAAYYNSVVVETKLPDAGTLEANRDSWAADGGLRIRRALRHSAQQVARLIGTDLEYQQPADMTLATGTPYQEGMFKGRLVAEGAEGKLVRFDDGTIKYHVALDAIPAPTAAPVPALASESTPPDGTGDAVEAAPPGATGAPQ